MHKAKLRLLATCFGGTGALETARAGFDVTGVVSIHGGLSKAADRPNASIKTKVLIENPAEDKGVTKEIYDLQVQELKGWEGRLANYYLCQLRTYIYQPYIKGIQ